jgi:hypothetical protein
MLKRTLGTAIVACGLISGAATAATGDASSYSLRLSGFVPLACRAQLSSTAVPTEGGQVSLGSLDEFCNNASGFEVWVDYSPSLAGGKLNVDGKNYDLDASGSVRIDSSPTPAVASKSVSLDTASGVSGSLSIRVVPL